MWYINHYFCKTPLYKLMNKKYISVILFFLVNCAIAQVKHTVTKSTITFQIKNLGFNTHGTINGLQGNIAFDPANPEKSTVDAIIDVSTINTDNDLRDEHLKGDSYFNLAKYPQITIKSVLLKHKSGDNYTGQFNLTIKDKTQLTEIPFTYTTSGNAASFKGSFKMKRSDFDIGGSSMVLSNDVIVTIDVQTSK
jgi:polyisoprenoid-binding protein YceI